MTGDNNSPLAAKDATVHVESTDDGESWYEVAEVDAKFEPDVPIEPLSASEPIDGGYSATFEVDSGDINVDELIDGMDTQTIECEYTSPDGEATDYEVLDMWPAPIGFVRACELPDEVDALAEVGGGMTMALKEVGDDG